MSDFKQMDRLTSQLYYLPNIIARLGLGIAEAQKEFNIDYVNSVGRLMQLIKETVGKDGAVNSDAMEKLLVALAPSRYQFTETTIDFSADLSEKVQRDIQVGGGLSLGAVMVNAAMTLAYGHDYRASARITSVLHARPAGGDPNFAQALLARAKELDSKVPALPDKPTGNDAALLDATKAVYDGLIGKVPAPKKDGAEENKDGK